MSKSKLQQEQDPVLDAVIHARGDARRELMARLLAESADPVIDQILRRTQIRSGFQAEDVDDLRSLVRMKLLERLGQGDAIPAGPEPIHSFAEFVAVTTYHAVDDLLRKRYPERARLKARIRHLLTTDPSLAMASDGRRTAAGLAGWDLTAAIDVAAVDIARVPRPTATMRDAARPAEAVRAVLAAIGRPMDLDALVTLLGELWSIPLKPRGDGELLDSLVSTERDASSRVETRQSLTLLWQEIRALPPDQRVALLLNLRDGQRESAISLFVFTGIADVAELAASVSLTHAELDAIWPELPLEDSRIAALLGVSRQQVINLRKSARARLARRKQRGGF